MQLCEELLLRDQARKHLKKSSSGAVTGKPGDSFLSLTAPPGPGVTSWTWTLENQATGDMGGL